MVAQRLPTEPEAIFIVGVARSGTTMMRYLLETSERIAIARENHFMGHYFGRRGARHYFRQAGDLAEDATIRRIVDMLYSGEYARHSRWRNVSPYWRWLTESVAREELERRLLAAERSERGLFATFLRLYADAQGRPVMGEKTPTHLGHVDELLEWFPDARVIHMLRDPRAIYVSDRHRRKTRGRPPYSYIAKVPLLLESWLLVMTAFSWRRALRRHRRLERQYPGRYLLVRFEDVLQRYEETVPRLSEFLGIDLPVAPESVRVPARHGMRSSEEGLDPAAADRWRERIRPIARRILELTLRGPMSAFGYHRA
jgi:hypothetical protein